MYIYIINYGTSYYLYYSYFMVFNLSQVFRVKIYHDKQGTTAVTYVYFHVFIVFMPPAALKKAEQSSDLRTIMKLLTDFQLVQHFC